MSPATSYPGLAAAAADVAIFSSCLVRRPLRHHQIQAARAILRSVAGRQGRVFTVVKAAQSECFWAAKFVLGIAPFGEAMAFHVSSRGCTGFVSQTAFR